jgi:hypothetical protein
VTHQPVPVSSTRLARMPAGDLGTGQELLEFIDRERRRIAGRDRLQAHRFVPMQPRAQPALSTMSQTATSAFGSC